MLKQARRTVERIEVLAEAWPKERGTAAENRDKVVNEAALLLYLADRAAQVQPGLRDAADALADAMAPAIRSDRVRALLLRRRRSAPVFRMADLILRRTGRLDADFSAVIDRNSLPRQHDGEQIAFRILETRWVEMLAGGSEPAFDDLLPHSVFLTDLDVLEMDRLDLYAVTHWLMYVSDFGRLPVPAQLRDAALRLLHDAVAWQLAEQDFDLLGELLLAFHFLRHSWSRGVDAVFRVMAEVWQKQSFLPSPGLNASHYASLTGAAREAYATAYTYHTQFVFGILALCLLEHSPEQTAGYALGIDGAVPDRESERRAMLVVAQRAREFAGEHGPAVPIAGDAGGGSHWQQIAHALGQIDANRPLLAELQGMEAALRDRLVLDGAIIRAVRDYNLAALAALLQLILDSGQSASPVAWRAAHWLARQQTTSGAIGIQFVSSAQSAKAEARIVAGTLGALLGRWGLHAV